MEMETEDITYLNTTARQSFSVPLKHRCARKKEKDENSSIHAFVFLDKINSIISKRWTADLVEPFQWSSGLLKLVSM